MDFRHDGVRRRIREGLYKAFRAEETDSHDAADALAFQMSDWVAELQKLHEAYQSIDSLTTEELYNTVLEFLTHAEPSIHNAAKSVFMEWDDG